MLPSRRSFLTGLAAAFAAPAIVRATSLMPIKAISADDQIWKLLQARIADAERVLKESMAQNIYGDLTDVARRAFVPRLFVQTYDHFEMSVPISFDKPRK